MRRRDLILASVLVIVVLATPVYLWTGKKAILTEKRHHAGEINEFALLEYRFRPILFWRLSSTGTRIIREETFGAMEMERLDSARWCGGNAGVYVSGIVRYHYGESHPLRLFYGLASGALVTTLDSRTKTVDVDNAFRAWASPNHP